MAPLHDKIPIYGALRLTLWLQKLGFSISQRHVWHLMHDLSIKAVSVVVSIKRHGQRLSIRNDPIWLSGIQKAHTGQPISPIFN